MTIPTGPVSLSNLRSEFGGAAPDYLSEYYRGGALVPASQSTSTADGVAISAGGTIRLGMFRGITRVTYAVSPTASSVNEGSAVTFNVSTTGVNNGTTLYWTILDGSTAAADFSASSSSVVINSNAGSFTVTVVADSSTEGAQTFQVQLRTDSTSGPVVATSSAVTINDTSTSGGVTSAFGGAMTTSYLGAGYSSYAIINFNGDGTVSGSISPTTAGPYIPAVNGATGDYWYTPTTASIGNSYWIRATATSGSNPSNGALNTWQQIGSGKSWRYMTATVFSGQSRVTGSLLLEISPNSSGSPVVASGTYNVDVMVSIS